MILKKHFMEIESIKILIASNNRPVTLKKTINSIIENKVPKNVSVAIIIIENGVKSKIEDFISKLKMQDRLSAKYCYIQQAGKSKALNYALKNFCDNKDFIMFTDDDTIVGKEWISGYLDAIKQHGQQCFYGGGIKVPEYVSVSYPFLQKFLLPSQRGFDYTIEEKESNCLFIGPNWGAFYSHIYKCGFFDEKLGPGTHIPLGDETLLQEKLQNLGLKPYYIKNNYVTHNIQIKKIKPKDIIKKNYIIGKRRVHCNIEVKPYYVCLFKILINIIRIIIHFFNIEKRFKYRFQLSYNLGILVQKVKSSIS